MPHKNLIYSICIKYTFNQEDIEDNYIEALANFFKYMDSYDPARPVKTWIYAVTKRLVADLNTRNRSRTPADDNAQIGELRSTLLAEDEPTENCMGMDNYRGWRGTLASTRLTSSIPQNEKRRPKSPQNELLLHCPKYFYLCISNSLHHKGT